MEFLEQKKRSRKPSIVVPAEVAEILGRAPLLQADDRDWYEDTRAKFAAVIKPEDCVIWIFVDDFAYYTAEILRFRGMRAAVIDFACKYVLYDLMIGPINEGKMTIKVPIEKYLKFYFFSADVRGNIEDIFGITIEGLTAKAYELEQKELAAIDKVLFSLEARRMAVLREIELRRILVARRLRETSQQIFDAAETQLAPVKSAPAEPSPC